MATETTGELRTGLAVRGADGRHLGTLVGLESGALVVERGFFWPRRFTVSRSDVGTVAGGEVRLLAGAATREQGTGEKVDPHSWKDDSAPREAPVAPVRTHAEAGDLRVPLAREEAQAVVRTRDVGAVR
ncbi:hypothetical protein, partial [Archangium sp.]|uniref:hypothetical protein n=1 Tax=Archangium sp. TaxID=1872627 RepID=UPI002EE57C5E